VTLTERLARLPLVRVVAAWYARRPRLVSWALLAAGMVILLTLFSQGAGLEPRNYAALVVATLALAWLCVWIIALEEDEAPPA
jgi:hypothetical protein